MPVIASPAYSNPQMGQIVQNLGAAIFGDPETRMKRGYYDAESARANAQAGKAGAETDGLNIKNAALRGLDDVTAALVARPGETAADHAARVAPYMATIMRAGGGNANDLAQSFNTGIGSVFAQGDVNDQGRSLVMQGKMPTKDFAPTAERSDQIQARDAADDRKTKFGVANINEAGANKREGMREQGLSDRLFAAPVATRPGEKVYLSNNDPRRSVMGNNGVVEGAPTVDTVRGQAGATILATPDGKVVPSNIANVFNGAGKGGMKPKAVNAKMLNDAVTAAGGLLKGATTAQENGKPPILDAGFEDSLDPDARNAGRQAASEVLAATGDVQAAGVAYLKAAGIQPGSSYAPTHSGLGALLFGKGGVQAPVAAAPAAAPAASPAPAATSVAIPPPEQRIPGKTTAVGRDGVTRTWTQNGWVASQPGA